MRSEHFETVANLEAAAQLVAFQPRLPAFTAGFELESLAVHVADHRKRPLAVQERSLEAHYGGFVIDQKRASSADDAKRRALSTSYGSNAQLTSVAGREARSYALGPEPDPDDIDGRRPSVVVWCDANMFFLLASSQLEHGTLLQIATSLYP